MKALCEQRARSDSFVKDSLGWPTGKVLTVFGWIQSKRNLKPYILNNVAEMHKGGNAFFP